MSHFLNGPNTNWNYWKYPIMRNKVGNNTFTYSPLVYGINENGTNVLKSPWSADLVVRPDRGLKTNDVWGDNWDDVNPSNWEYYITDSYYDTKLKVISAYTKDNKNYYASYNCGSGYINLQPWAQKYYIGLEYDSSDPTQTNGKTGGIFWNLNTLSSRTHDFNDLYYSMLGIVSINKKVFQTYSNVSYNYTWGSWLPSGHYYNSLFGFVAEENISKVSVTGDLDPFDFRLNVSFKGGHQIFPPLYEGGQSALHVGSDHDRGFTAASAYSLKSPLLRTIMDPANTAQAALMTPIRQGLVKHFNIVNHNFDYFLIDCWNIPFSTMFPQYSAVSGISSPIITLTVNHNSGSTQEDHIKYAVSGLVWKNAVATAQTVQGNTARITGNIHLAPFIGNSMWFLENFANISPNFTVMDMSFGISAQQGT